MRLLPLLIAVALLAGCSTPDSRIAEHRAAFDRFPAAVQEQIRAGKVAVGFTPEMVRMALGEPDRVFTRRSGRGDTEVWGYHDRGPRFSLGIGLGTGGRHSSVGGGVALSTGGYDPEEKLRVEFRDGKVTAVDTLKR
ncbi:MAG: hypothetical protein HYV75_01075 [Opitutae bacterium]|nr:hypothetical protein [Opitutae bacterium]